MIVTVCFSTSTKEYAYKTDENVQVGDLVVVANIQGDLKIVTVASTNPSDEAKKLATKSIVGTVNLF